ncbi:MAG: M48 family metalloprotease, partial [Lysobacter sp.]|nr:M48 family metalloprotease [Lysobacter sp.]
MTSHALEPLPYHRAVVRHLREKEPEVWAWASSVRVQQEHAELLRKELLRNTYRLTGQSHPQVQQAAELAAQRLGLSLPVTLYQGADGPMNATLIFLPGEAHVMFTGPMLERFSQAELLAVLGHELSHYVLWTVEEGTFHAADRILVQAAADPGAQGCQRETARLYSLYTEIFADRGGVLAAKDAAPVISTLVKTQTGLSSVDAAAYLEQGREIDLLEPARSEALSHPESYLRAQAMDRWWRQEGEVDEWLRRRI